jgi:hypothetical protein
VMTSCRYDDGVPVESAHSNELFFPREPVCVDADCDDGNPCTLDYCLGDGCSHDGLGMDGQSCDDGDPCNGHESCSDGVCRSGPVPVCADPGPCQIAFCDPDVGCVTQNVPDGTSCADDDLCNGSEWCNSGGCLPGTPLECTDPLDPCKVGSCDAALGCVSQNIADGTSCDDGNSGTHGDVCTDGYCTGTPTDSTSKKLCSGGDHWNPNACTTGKDPTHVSQKGGRGKKK